MRRIIRLADLSHIPTPSYGNYTQAEMESARRVMVARNLRWDNARGMMFDDRWGNLSRYSNPSEFEPHTSEEDVMRWEFRCYIANSAGRVRGGYPP